MSFFTAEKIEEFMSAIDFLRGEIVALDEKYANQNVTHEKKWLYSKGFDYSFNFYEDFTENLRTNLNLGGEDIYYADQVWEIFFEKYGFSIKQVSPFFNDDYVKFYFSDSFSSKVEKVTNILTHFRHSRLEEELKNSDNLKKAKIKI